MCICGIFISAPTAPTNWHKGKILGAGAFGQVFMCHDNDTGRTLAVKQVQLVVRNSEISKVSNKQEQIVVRDSIKGYL